MEYVILGLLMMQDSSLYDLHKAFKSGISLFYSASYGSIQRTVRKLVDQGLVSCTETVESGRNKKVHSIKPTGREAFIRWMESPLQRGAKMESHALTRLYFLGLLDRDKQRAVLEEDISAVIEILTELEQVRQSVVESFPGVGEHPQYKYQLKTLEYGIMSHRAALEWFEKERDRL